MRLAFAISLIACLTGLSPVRASAASSAPAAPAALDTNRIHTLYLEGDFEHAIAILEQGLKDGRIVTHSDSIFAFKHLGVMYAADNNSREKGKYYMLNLVTIEPTARIMDMYASDMIYMIFKNIQEEYQQTKGKLIRAERHVAGNQGLTADSSGTSDAPPARTTASKKPSHTTRNVLLAGGAVAALVGAGIAAHYILEEAPADEKVSHDIER